MTHDVLLRKQQKTNIWSQLSKALTCADFLMHSVSNLLTLEEANITAL